MKFNEKYELLESLTTGAVETFVANDKVRGERVLVHIVECAPQKPDQTTAEWVLESFRRLAPEPPGPVLETGKYSGAKYAYVVTKPPDENVVKAWVRRYELQAEETKETKVHALKQETSASTFAPPSPTPITPKEPQQAPPGQMTQLFRDFDSLAKSKTPEPSTPPNSLPVRPASSSSLPGESGLHAAVPWDPASMKSASPPKEPPFTSAPSPIKPVSPEPSHPVVRDGAKPGEFTSFFQGPFRGDGPSDMPAYSSQPIEPPKKNVGEFTALFGGATPKPPTTPAPPSAPGSSFTSMFKDMDTPQGTFNASTPMQGSVVPPAQALPPVSPVHAAPTPDPVFASSPAVIPDLPAPAIPAFPSMPVERPVPPRPSSMPGDGATGAFMRPKSDPMPVPTEAPSGPSPYTQIISRSKLAGAEAAEAGHGPAAGAGAGKFAVPPMPKIPGAAPPPMPKIPPAPAMPKMTAPKAPKIDASAPPPVSIWPLVITLTVLFFLAVILVLFFVLKH